MKEESFAQYGSRIVTLLLSKWKAKDLEKIAVSVELAHMAQIDNNLLRSVFTTNVATRNELQQQLQAYAFKKRNNEDDSAQEKKKSRMQSQTKCHFCAKVGHKFAECRARMEGTSNTKGRSHSGSNTPGSKDRSNIRCFKCDEMRHVASVCPKGNNK
ncbi:uncharacterized protein LOC122319605 [Drosophila yakuba]|uniref:uncharacterized protein LOC122319605 n=1 Tax=Drosophila yakuba TaxID=7245 RepID=UPI001C89E788|nr:uncharacterized protein LOC122319605 [Drosophila yakuba]